MKRFLIVSATLAVYPVQLAWAAPPSAAVSTATPGTVTPGTSPSVQTAPVVPATEPFTGAAPAPAPTEPGASTSMPTPSITPAPSATPSATPAAPPTAPPATAPSVSSASVEPSPYGPSTAEQNQQRNRERVEGERDVPATLVDGNADYAFGGFGGVSVMYTRIAGKNAPLVCGEGAVIIDHALTLGGGGCGLPRMLKAQDYSPNYDANDRMTFGYGGAIGRYHFRSRKLVNVSVGALVGAGGVTTGSWDKQGNDWEEKFSDQRHDAVFVFEPQVGAHINITRWLRAGAVVGYRLVSGVDTKGLSSSELSGITAGGQLQGGWF